VLKYGLYWRYCSGGAIGSIYIQCVCNLRYPVCNAQEPFVICGLSGSTVFFTLFHKLRDFRKKNVLSIKYVV
jgi:hypothetical protein